MQVDPPGTHDLVTNIFEIQRLIKGHGRIYLYVCLYVCKSEIVGCVKRYCLKSRRVIAMIDVDEKKLKSIT